MDDISKAMLLNLTIFGTILALLANPIAAKNLNPNFSSSIYKSLYSKNEVQKYSTKASIKPIVIKRSSYIVTTMAKPKVKTYLQVKDPVVLPQTIANPGSAQAIAKQLVTSLGWDANQFTCLLNLWNKESGWRVNANNSSSGAYGIPQALPGSKMASVGADWKTNPATQITWGMNYLQSRYVTPCNAWEHSKQAGWY